MHTPPPRGEAIYWCYKLSKILQQYGISNAAIKIEGGYNSNNVVSRIVKGLHTPDGMPLDDGARESFIKAIVEAWRKTNNGKLNTKESNEKIQKLEQDVRERIIPAKYRIRDGVVGVADITASTLKSRANNFNVPPRILHRCCIPTYVGVEEHVMLVAKKIFDYLEQKGEAERHGINRPEELYEVESDIRACHLPAYVW